MDATALSVTRINVQRAYGSLQAAAAKLCELPWRQGHREPCNVYAALNEPESYKYDFEIAVFKTPALAAEAVRAHNQLLNER